MATTQAATTKDENKPILAIQREASINISGKTALQRFYARLEKTVKYITSSKERV